MKILVTGAAGFIGTRLCAHLRNAGDDVVALDKEDLTRLEGISIRGIRWDIRDDSKITKLVHVLGDVKACIHLAAIAAPRKAQADQHLAWDTNVRGTQNVLSLCRAAGIRKIVFASSAHVYGISPRYMPTDEQHPLHPLDAYTATKIAGEELCRLHHASYGISSTVLRLFNAYGPGQSPDYFLGVKLSQALAGGPITVANGAVTKDWIYVDDVVRAFAMAVRTPYVGPLNVGTGVETSLLDMASKIGGLTGLPVIPDPAVDVGPTRMCCDPRRALHVLGWSPTVGVDEGLGRLVRDARGAPA